MSTFGGFERLHLKGVLLLTLVTACDLTPDDRVVGLAPPPLFVVESTSIADGAQDVPLNQPISVVFTHYLDPDSFQYFNALRLRSGGIGASGFTRYRMIERSLTFYPTSNLRPELIYTLSLDEETVRALNGEALALPLELSFQTAADGTVEQERRVEVRSFAADVAPILGAHCSCHAESEALVGLEYDALVAQPSRAFSDRLLVRPFDAPASYLLHKILPDYPDRRWSVMPPPYSDERLLEPAELGIIEDWIATGADP